MDHCIHLVFEIVPDKVRVGSILDQFIFIMDRCGHDGMPQFSHNLQGDIIIRDTYSYGLFSAVEYARDVVPGWQDECIRTGQ